jgi:hypothetical protein
VTANSTTARSSSETYARYEAALASLTATPGLLDRDLAEADRAARALEQDSRRLMEQELDRVSKLRATLESRFIARVRALKEHGVLLPDRLRPAGADPLEGALEQHAQACLEVDRTLASITATPPVPEPDRGTTDALRRRKERLAEAKRTAAENAAKEAARLQAERQRAKLLLRRRLLIGLGAVVVIVLVIVVLILTQS